ncbi:LexA family protein [Maribacter sp.]
MKTLQKETNDKIYVGKLKGDSMKNAGLDNGDLLIVDTTMAFYDGCLAVCEIDQQEMVKRIRIENENIVLIAENPNYENITIQKSEVALINGVVTHAIKDFSRPSENDKIIKLE